MYSYIKALHIIFIVTWFSGMFYIVRLFIYHREAQDLPETEKQILSNQFKIMSKRLWLGITWPSAILTMIFGTWMGILFGSMPSWLWTKLGFVVGLFAYHHSLQYLYKSQQQNRFPFSSMQLRIWNEVATIFLLAIVMLVVVKQGISLAWGLGGLVVVVLVLMSAIRIYKQLRR